MTTFNATFIYLGNLPLVDVNEADTDAENASALLGTYQDNQMQVVAVANEDADDEGEFDDAGDGIIWDDESPAPDGGPNGDFMTYDVGGGPISVSQDASMLFNARVTAPDGTTQTGNIVVIQATNGDTFIIGSTGGTSITENTAIDQIELLSVVGSNYTGRSTNYTNSNVTICFASGTQILTAGGPVLVEQLCPGTRLWTLDAGFQPLASIAGTYHATPGRHAAIHIAAGALGPGLPEKPLRVSPQHRMLVHNRIVPRMFDCPEVFVAAKALLALPGVSQDPPEQPLTYWHLALASHHIVSSNAC